jgi:hypothetical protein
MSSRAEEGGSRSQSGSGAGSGSQPPRVSSQPDRTMRDVQERDVQLTDGEEVARARAAYRSLEAKVARLEEILTLVRVR